MYNFGIFGLTSLASSLYIDYLSNKIKNKKIKDYNSNDNSILYKD